VLALDAGPMLMRRSVPIGDADRSIDLEKRLAEAGADLVVRALDQIEAGAVRPEAQDDARATYAARLVREDGNVDWHQPARAIHNRIRGLHPWPLVSATIDGTRVKLVGSRVADESTSEATGMPGEIVRVDRDGLYVATGSGVVVITELQPEGRTAMAVRDYLNGRVVKAGTVLDPPARQA
jgi:methionyl-tRNA formyltransferase